MQSTGMRSNLCESTGAEHPSQAHPRRAAGGRDGKRLRDQPQEPALILRQAQEKGPLGPGFRCPYPDCGQLLPSRHGLRIHLGTDHDGLDYEASRRCARCHILFDEDNPRAEGQRICTDCAGELKQGHFVIAVAPPEAHPSNGLWAGRPDSETLRQQRWDRYNEKRRKA